MSTDIQFYNFDPYTKVTAYQDDNGDPLVCASDLCDCLGLKSKESAYARIEEEFKVIVSNDTLGGMQNMVFLREPGVYQLMTTVRLRKENPHYDRIKAFRKWVFGEVLPTIRRTGFYAVPMPEQPADVQPSKLAEVEPEIKAAISIGRMMGLDDNQALLSANRYALKTFNVDLMTELQIALPSPGNSTTFTPTQLAMLWQTKSGQKRSAQAVNGRLSELGLQTRFDGVWRLSEAGKQHGLYLDVPKANAPDGTNVQQIKWRESVVPLVLGV